MPSSATVANRGRIFTSASCALGAALLIAASCQPAAPAPTAPTAPSQPADRILRLRWAESSNRHRANQAGADNTDRSGEVSLTLRAGGRSRAVDRGTATESVLDGDWFRETRIEWNSTWLGTWKRAGRTLRLELERDQRTCAVTEVERRGAQELLPRVAPCPDDPPHLSLVCEAETVEVDPSDADPRTAPAPTRAWACSPPGDLQMKIGTPFRWVFGARRCLESRTGVRGELSYADCSR